MKDYYSESDKKKFIITNNTDVFMTSEEFAKELFHRIFRDAKDRFILMPGKSIQIECSDDWENLFEKYLVDNFSNSWGAKGDTYISDAISIKEFEER